MKWLISYVQYIRTLNGKILTTVHGFKRVSYLLVL